MPNNPGRIDGDYSIGEHEEVKYVDPGNFGAVRADKNKSNLKYIAAFIVGMAIIAVFFYLS